MLITTWNSSVVTRKYIFPGKKKSFRAIVKCKLYNIWVFRFWEEQIEYAFKIILLFSRVCNALANFLLWVLASLVRPPEC